MDEILASIRRIIADDQEALEASEADAPEQEVAPSSPLRSVLDLAERHAAPAYDRYGHEDVLSHDTGFQAKSFVPGIPRGYEEVEPPALQPVPDASGSPSEQSPAGPGDPMLSSRARESVSDSFSRLNAAVLPAQPRTIEDLMKEMLRPMLKQWLDDNLPSLVEGLVRVEIERIARRQR